MRSHRSPAVPVLAAALSAPFGAAAATDPPTLPPPPDAAPPEPADRFGDRPWWEWEHATGDWGGARPALAAPGLTLDGSYTIDWASVWEGGVRNRASTRTLLDLNATLDLGVLAGVEGGTVFADFYSTDGRGHGDAGDLQGFSSIETEQNLDQLAELWYEQTLLDGRLRLKLGKVDANGEFAVLGSATTFINSSAAFSPTFLLFPSYPDPATSVNVFANPAEHVHLGFGLYDGAAGDGVRTGGRGPASFFSDDRSADWFLIAEAALTWETLGAARDGRLGVGLWHHTGDLPTFDGGTDDGTTGFYLTAEQRLLARDTATSDERTEDDDGGLWIFAQYGRVDEDVSEVVNHAAVGLTLRGTFPARDADEAGVYISFAGLSDAEGAAFEGDETAVELFYAFRPTPFLTIQPDLQWIRNPSGDTSIDDAVVGLLRVEVTF